MGEILKPVSNLPLTCPSTPGILRRLKGCRFEPGVWLARHKLYLIVVTQNPPELYQTISGFYEVPDKGIVAFIREFKPLQVSHRSEAGTRAIVYEAIEGDPPLDWKPEMQFDYRQYTIDKIVARRAERMKNNGVQ